MAENGDKPKPRSRSRAARKTARKPVTIEGEASATVESAASEAVATDEPAMQATPIDNQPEAVTETAEATPPQAPEAVPSPANGRSFLPMVLAAVIGGFVALILLVSLQSFGVVPSPGQTNSEAALQSVGELASRVDGGQEASDAMASQIAALRDGAETQATDMSAQLALQDEALASLKRELAELQAELDAREGADLVTAAQHETSLRDLEATLRGELPRVDAAAESAEEMAAMVARIDALETGLQTLENRPAAPAASGVALARLLLKGAASGSAPFIDELEAAQPLLSLPGVVDELRPMAESGVASREDLRRSFAAVAASMRNAQPEEGASSGISMDWLDGLLGGLVSVQVADGSQEAESVENDPVAAMEDAVSQGDLEAALLIRQDLPQEAQDGSSDWAAEVSQRISLDLLIEELTAPAHAGNAG